MILIPFVYKKIKSLYPVHLIHIFLKKGIFFLQLDTYDIDTYCNENGLYFIQKHIVEDTCFIEIDINKTKMNEFYTYYENSAEECWRRFLLVGDYSEDFLHVNHTNPEFIQPVLKTILHFKETL